ncbi:MAG TPA: hypothetical protein PLQ88_00615, partial [Blastocatellia bacterium]|nr:hypothetical protein [Blastocatellia bacterium]
NPALSNLASVAINASLIANANNTLDLGSAGVKWRDAYIGRDLNVGGHEITSGSAPSIAAGIAAGSGASASISGNDICGLISLTCGASPTTNSTLLTVTFANAYAAAPQCVTVTPANVNAGNHVGRWFTNAGNTSTTQFVLRVGATALSGSGFYQFYYEVKG